GHRSWGSPIAAYGFAPPAPAIAQEEIDREVLIAAMIETAEAVANADAIAATPGIDALLIGTSDLTADMGIAGQIGHERVAAAYASVGAACSKHGKTLGMGGVYDDTHAKTYIGGGARLVLGGADGGFLLAGATARATLLRAG
ncbi:MAG: aldolase, partial [Acetobacteraceae bacterium]|nr:aldolase [Acetobacteraceae bacterium]